MLPSKVSVWTLVVLVIFSTRLSGACRPGEQAGKIIKIIDEDLFSARFDFAAAGTIS